MGNHQMPKPKSPADVILFTEQKLVLRFDKSSFIPENSKYPQPKKIIVLQRSNGKIIGVTRGSDLTIFLKDQPSLLEEIRGSMLKILEIEFYGIWNEKKLEDHDSSESKETFVQKIQLTTKPDLYGLDISDEEKVTAKIQEYREKIITYDQRYPIKQINILLFGLSPSGKSSFINTLNYCLNENANPQVFAAAKIGFSSTLSFQERKLLPWLSIWDSPGLNEDKDYNCYANIPIFYEKVGLKNLCLHTKLVSDEKDLEKLEIDTKKLLPQENQIHSVIFLWSLAGPNCKKFFIHHLSFS